MATLIDIATTLNPALNRPPRPSDPTQPPDKGSSAGWPVRAGGAAGPGGHGTDHRTAGPLFVLGRGVRGGLFGEEPSLTDLDGGDLKASTDFRAVYGSLLRHVLDTEPGKILLGCSGEVEGLLR